MGKHKQEKSKNIEKKNTSDEEEEYSEGEIEEGEEGEIEEEITLRDVDVSVLEIQSLSPLKKHLDEAERIFESIKGDLQKIEKMKIKYEDIVKGGLFDDDELSEYQKSLQYHAERQHINVKTIVHKLNTAKEIWEQKKKLMGEMWMEGVLDEGVVKVWQVSMSNYENRISRIDTKLQFLYGGK